MAVLFFQIAHYAMRPWPWIIVALASLVVFPDLASIGAEFPNIDESILKDDLAYPAMLTRLPAGLLGVVIASLIAAFMSTISTHLNWGSSYLAHDFYRRFIKPDANDAELVNVGRISTVLLMVVACVAALSMQSAKAGFDVILQIGAGTGLIFILRWFWWRVNAWTEMTGMLVSFLVACYFAFAPDGSPLTDQLPWVKMLVGVGITTIAWFAVTMLTRPTDHKTLENFYQKVRPDGAGWEPVRASLAEKGINVSLDGSLTSGIMAMVAATFLVYALLFGTGYLLYGQTVNAIVSAVVAIAATIVIVWIWPRLKMS
jgi:Na+/proline symporter